MSRALALAMVLLVACAPAAAARACVRTSVADLEDEVMCPVCGTSLAIAREAPLARRERALIQRLVVRCRTKAQIKARLVAEFGPSVLAVPPDRGFGAAAYLVPVAGGLLALLGAAALLARWRRRPTPHAAPQPPPAAADSADLERALDRLR